jgi:hypothetical protein
MTDKKIINIFNKQPVETTVDRSEIDEVLEGLAEMKDSIQEILVITLTKEDEMLVRSGNMTRESAYFVLGLAQFNALVGD